MEVLFDQLREFGVYRLASTAAALYIVYVGIQIIRDPFKHIPGPWFARYSRLWLLNQYIKGDYHHTDIELHRKHGPIVRIGPNQFSIDDPDAAKAIYGHGTQFRKSDWYDTWGIPGETNLFKETDPAVHAATRRVVSSLYSMSNLVSYEPYVDECNSILCDRLAEFARSGSTFDMHQWLECWAFDVIGLITLSRRFGTLDSGQDVGDHRAAGDIQLLVASSTGVFPALYPPIFSVMMFLARFVKKGPGKEGHLFDFIDAVIDERSRQGQNEGSGPEDFISKVLRKKAEGEEINRATMVNSVGANIGAGTDTTAIALTAILYYLCVYPETMKKLRAEVDAHAKSRDSGSPITFKQAQSLPYLQAVVREGLRIYPATGYTLPRVVPAGGMVIAGQFFPAGSVVGINAWVAHRNRSVYGEDVGTFRPERWLEAQQNNTSHLLEAYNFSFGQGSRGCIGKNISILEITKCLPHILERFDFKLVDKAEPAVTNHWFVKQKSLPMRVRERAK
ncbi:cytochrome P450 [Xylariales sp. PMI_506]|nr:cytochrome P450 [Xylariales sp. PMI_506]